MKYLILSFILGVLSACQQQIKVFENEDLVMEIIDFPSQDTVIAVKDYFLTYKKSGIYIEGKIESEFNDNRGDFKSLDHVYINIGKTFKVEL